MSDYSFDSLNDKEFESLANDLVSKELKVKVERFTTGPDGGIDGQFYSMDNGQSIIQAKHYQRSGFRALKAKFKNFEFSKIQKINPQRYIIATSVGLTPKNKADLIDILSPYVKGSEDIFGADDLNSLLRKYPDIERAHYKLWITSSAVLQTILNKTIYDRSEEFKFNLRRKAKFIARTSNYFEAIGRLDRESVLIICGEPGSGKTTLAEMICLHYLAIEKDVFYITSIVDGEKVFITDPKQQQIFLYDDFLGSNYLEALKGNDDAHITRFIKRIEMHPNHKLIMTSRTSILNKGISTSDKFKNYNLDSNKYAIEVSKLLDIDKANILYNHIWHSDLSKLYIDELYKEETYMEIIKHKNFNPRIIEFITSSRSIKNIDADQYFKFIKQNLLDTSNIWKNYFNVQNNEYLRGMVILLVYSGGHVKEEIFRQSFSNLLPYLKSISEISTNQPINFDNNIEVAAGAFINRVLTSDKETEIHVFNPAINDYVYKEYSNSPEYLIAVFKAIGTAIPFRIMLGLIGDNGLLDGVEMSPLTAKKIVMETLQTEEEIPLDISMQLINIIDGIKCFNDITASFILKYTPRLVREIYRRNDIGPTDFDIAAADIILSIKLFDQCSDNPISNEKKLKVFSVFFDTADYSEDDLFALSEYICRQGLVTDKEFNRSYCIAIHDVYIMMNHSDFNYNGFFVDEVMLEKWKAGEDARFLIYDEFREWLSTEFMYHYDLSFIDVRMVEKLLNDVCDGIYFDAIFQAEANILKRSSHDSKNSKSELKKLSEFKIRELFMKP